MIRFGALGWLLVAGTMACSAGAKKQDNDLGYDTDLSDPPLPSPLEASTVMEDDGSVLNLGDRQNDGGDQGRPDDDGGVDAGPAQPCSGPIAVGDVKVVEFMVASAANSGDHGEWIELQNTLSCILDVNGLRVESPRGTGTDSATIGQTLLIPPGGSFVVADSTDTVTNHHLPIVAASFNSYDVLKNDGDTINVYVGTTLIDTLTYPKFATTYARSISFPADCAWSDRADWARWSFSFNVWSSPFQGTPGADNTDVACY